MGVRDRKKAERRARIEASARALFAERGFEGTTIRAVARGAGVSSGTVLNYFESKVDLLYQLFHAELEQTIAARWATLPGDASLLDQLDHVFGGFLENYGANPDLARVYVRESLTLPPAQRARYDDLAAGFLDGLAALVRAHAHALRDEVEPLAVALQAFALYQMSAAELLSRPEACAARAQASCRALLESMLAPLWRGSGGQATR